MFVALSMGKSLKRWTLSIITFLAILVIAEGILRLIGMQPHIHNDYPVHSDPDLALLPSIGFGFALNPGIYQVTVRDSLRFSVTHTADSTRYCGKSGGDLNVHIHGCSYTYGFGVNDSDTYPWKLQEANPKWQITNYAVPGFGTIQGLLRLKDEIRVGNIPDVVIIGYAGFHEERNALTRIQRQAWKEAMILTDQEFTEVFEKAAFPYGSITDNELQVKYYEMSRIYSNWPLRESSALVNWMENTYNALEDRASDKEEITRLVMDEIAKVTKNHGIRVLVVGLMPDDITLKMLDYCDELGWETVEAGVDLSDNNYNLMPWDGHPNANAHDHYFSTLNAYLQENR